MGGISELFLPEIKSRIFLLPEIKASHQFLLSPASELPHHHQYRYDQIGSAKNENFKYPATKKLFKMRAPVDQPLKYMFAFQGLKLPIICWWNILYVHNRLD